MIHGSVETTGELNKIHIYTKNSPSDRDRDSNIISQTHFINLIINAVPAKINAYFFLVFCKAEKSLVLVEDTSEGDQSENKKEVLINDRTEATR